MLAGPHFARDHGPADRRINRSSAADGPGLLEARDLLVRTANDTHPMTRGIKRTLRRPHIVLRRDKLCLRLLPSLQRRSLALKQFLLTLFGQLGQFELRTRLIDAGEGGDKFILRLHNVWTGELEQRISLFYLLAHIDNQSGDTSGKRRHHGCAGILVVANSPNRGLPNTERIELHRDHFKLMHLFSCHPERIAALSWIGRRPYRPCQCATDKWGGGHSQHNPRTYLSLCFAHAVKSARPSRQQMGFESVERQPSFSCR